MHKCITGVFMCETVVETRGKARHSIWVYKETVFFFAYIPHLSLYVLFPLVRAT